MTLVGVSTPVGRAFYAAIENEFGGELKIQFPGISTDQADEDDSEWLACYLLGGADLPSRKRSTIQAGQLQVSCFSRFHDKAKDNVHDRPYVIGDRVFELLNKQSFPILDKDGNPLTGCLTVISGSFVYLNEDEIGKAQVRNVLDPANVHAVIWTFRYVVSAT